MAGLIVKSRFSRSLAVIVAGVIVVSYLAVQHFSHAYGGGGAQVWVYANPGVNNACFLVDISSDGVNWVTNYEYPARCTGVPPSGYPSTTGAYMLDSTYPYYRLIFNQAPSGYSFKDWRLSNGQTTTGNSITFSNNIPSVYLDLNAPAPTPPAGPSLSVTGRSASSVSLSWSGGSPGSYGSVSGYNLLRNGSVAASYSPSATSAVAGSLACNTSYNFIIQLTTTGGASANSNQVSQTTSACPTPAPAPAPAPAPSSAPPKTSPGSGGVTAQPKTSSAPAVPAPLPVDTTPPAPPDSFGASVDSGNLGISLNWDAATDASGIAGYNLDRSTDKTNWSPLSAARLTGTSYDDQTTVFGAHYYYRLSATDTAGNTSGYVYADASTGGFLANASGGQGFTVTSADHLAVANIPAGALPDQQHDCQMITSQTAAKTSQSQVVGPYLLLCKDQDGNSIELFQKPVSWTINLKHLEKRFNKLSVAQLDQDGNVQDAKAAFNAKSDVMAFSSSGTGPFVVLGTPRQGVPWANIISLVVIVLAALGGVGYLIYRQRGKEDYDDYIRRKYYDF